MIRALAAALMAVMVGGLAVGFGASAQAAVPLTWSATIDGQPLKSATADHPLNLVPDTGGRVRLQVTNTGSTPQTVDSIRLLGRIMGLTFFTYRTQLDLHVPPGATTERTIDIDLTDLGHQAVGLVPSELQLIGPDHQVLAADQFAVDVHGSFPSVYGIFGLAVFGITALLLIGLATRLALGRLPQNRWQRAVQFLPAGLGLGLVLTVGLSSTGLMLPAASRWVPLVLGGGAIAFLAGYLSPTPHQEASAARRFTEGPDWEHLTAADTEVDLRAPAQVAE